MRIYAKTEIKQAIWFLIKKKEFHPIYCQYETIIYFQGWTPIKELTSFLSEVICFSILFPIEIKRTTNFLLRYSPRFFFRNYILCSSYPVKGIDFCCCTKNDRDFKRAPLNLIYSVLLSRLIFDGWNEKLSINPKKKRFCERIRSFSKLQSSDLKQ